MRALRGWPRPGSIPMVPHRLAVRPSYSCVRQRP